MSLTVHAISTDELIPHAHSLKLSQSRYWHLLMHAPHNESEIDDDTFFLVPDGKSNLSSELETTIKHLNEDINRSNGSVFCRFPARRTWLESELNTTFGDGECTEYEALLEKMDPQKVTLVFPSAHINSPASMFGHTFLRIDSSMESKLMSYAINYAAQTDETNGMSFAYKGLFGGYSGFYSMLPYYEKLKEYRDSESRDVWEYDLNLTHDEVMAMVRHIWELQGIQSWYYFLDENCSYNMLWLAEVARESIHLRDHFTYYVSPPETVRAFEEEGLVGEKHYRPSKRTKLLAYEKQLTPLAITTTKSLASGDHLSPDDNISVQQKQYSLEAAAELVEYDYIQGKLPKDAYALRYHELLRQRASLGQGEALVIDSKSNPDTAHHAARFELAKGWYANRSPYLIGWRPAFHDLSEDDTGQLSGAQIEFLDTLIGIENGRVSLERLTILSLASITPVSQFFKPFSWRMKAGLDREYGEDQLGFVTRIGAGSAIGNEKWYGYLLTEPEVRVGFKSDIGIGLSAGGAINWGNRMKTRIEMGEIVYVDAPHRIHGTLSHQWQVNPSMSFFGNFELNHQRINDDRMCAGVNLYF